VHPDLSQYRPGTWTTFPSLPLIGSGTSQVESLASYLMRLRDTLGVSRNSLLQLIDGSTCAQRSDHRSSIIGPGEICQRRAAKLGRLTGQDLVGSNLGPFGDVIQARGAGLGGRGQRRWCPACLTEEQDAGLVERLVWRFSNYSFCTLHETPILSECQSCGSGRLRFGKSNVHHECSFCGHSLRTQLAHRSCSPLERWTSATIDGMVAWSASAPAESRSLDSTNYQKFVQGLIDDGTMERIRKVHPIFWKDTVLFRRRRPTISTLINLAAIKSISVIGILTDPTPASSSNLFPLEDAKGLIACDLGDYSVASMKLEMLMQALLKSATQYLPSDVLLIRSLGAKSKTFSFSGCPSREQFCALRADKERQVLSFVSGARCVEIAFMVLRAGGTRAKASSAVRRQTGVSVLAAQHISLTASTILKTTSSKAFRAKG